MAQPMDGSQSYSSAREAADRITPTEARTEEPILQFFAFEHLPPHLQAVSKPFCSMAAEIVGTLPRNAERTVALRKLLESKDAAVRALLAK